MLATGRFGTGGAMTKQKISIIGGGIGGLTAAYELTDPKLKNKYDITLYQMGWRLGGKCATGRNQARNMRIEEHGIHAFAGSYYNGLTMMKYIYEELGAVDGLLPDFETAFVKKYGSFMWDYNDKQMKRWPTQYPKLPFHYTDAESFYEATLGYSHLSRWIAIMVLVILKQSLPSIKPLAKSAFTTAEMSSVAHNVPSEADKFLQDFQETGHALLEALEKQEGNLENGLESMATKSRSISASKTPNIPWWLYNLLLTKTPRPPTHTDEERHKVNQVEFLKTLLRGVRDDELATKGFASIDDVDFDDWLVKHGASPELMRSPLVTLNMFVTYQFPKGDLSGKPVMSASSFVQWTLRTASYLGAPFYLVEAGTGETLLSPLYRLLEKRGVKFEFFHELTDITLSSNLKTVQQLQFNVQATPKTAPYDPFIRVKTLDCWPSEPLWSQLENATALKGKDFEAPHGVKGSVKTLSVAQDFDSVILAIPPRATLVSAPSLIAQDSNWSTLKDMAVTATQSMQLWLNDDIETLTQYTDTFFVAGNYRSGMHGMAEFENILQYEDWSNMDTPPKGLVYFSGVMTSPHKTGDMTVRQLGNMKARNTAGTMLISSGEEVFQGAQNPVPTTIPYGFDFAALYPATITETGQDRLSSQYTRGNLVPSELYTQCPPGTKSLRIDPLTPPQTNMTVAGDWVDTRLNVGSVEGTIIGGRLAACYLEPSLDPNLIMGIQL